jgi:cytochrome c oxidase assembly protein subunit 15
MVASGLNNDTRTWVSAYKLVIHLTIATSLFGYLFWTWLMASQPMSYRDEKWSRLRRMGWGVVAVLFVQIAFGGLMAGMRAGLIHPHISVFVEGQRFWHALNAGTLTGVSQIIDYESETFVKAVVQLLHRGTAWLLAVLVIYLFLKIKSSLSARRQLKLGNYLLMGMLITQVLLGILTVINSVGRIPLLWGVAHQAGALILLGSLLYVLYQLGKKHHP